MKYILLLLIIGVKILLTELIGVGLVLLNFLIKGKLLTHNSWNSAEWNTYFVHNSDSSILKWGTVIYLTSSILASLIAYALFCVFDFEYPIFCAIILFVFCTLLTCVKYHRKGKKEIIDKLSSVRQTAKEELETIKIE